MSLVNLGKRVPGKPMKCIMHYEDGTTEELQLNHSASNTVRDPQELPLLLNMRHIQAITGLSRDMVYRLPHTQGFPVVRFGRSIRVPREAFLRWLERQAGLKEGE